MIRTMLMALTLTLSAVAGFALAQGGGGTPDPYAALSFEEALRLGAEQHRLVVVFPRGRGQAPPGTARIEFPLGIRSGRSNPPHSARTNTTDDPFDRMEQHTWRSPALRGWIEWHAIAVKVDEAEDPETWREVSRHVRANPKSGRSISEDPVVLVFKEGRLVMTIPGGGRVSPRPVAPGTNPLDFYPTPLRVLMELDAFMERLEVRDPVWHALHELKNPEPPMPPPTLFHEVESGVAKAVADPADAHPGAVIERWEEAREGLRNGARAEPLGLYTWLWERGSAHDPHAASAIRVVLTDEVRRFGHRYEPTRERFSAMRAAQERRAPWFAGTDLHDMLLLAEASGDDAETFGFMTLYHVEEDDAALMSIVQRAEHDLLLSRDRWSGVDVRPRDAEVWLARQVGLLGARRPANAPADQWGELQTLRRRL
ncbi:MAG: hypothetical protein KIS87_15440, partial [Phycisphaeraceae bacterium]|nr:hypothetical protein [Phycisphaeraceae bacterium]